jgi:rhodanese-related sulfurtransferase
MRTLIIITTMFLSNNPLSAQVKSNSLGLLLKTLLSNETKKITVPDAVNQFNNYIFLDAREAEEYNVSHILNSRFVGYKKFSLPTLDVADKKKPIVVYCSIGKRSDEITKKLTEAGFDNVKNLYGGIFEWVNQGHPVYDSQNKQTDSVHAYSKFWGRWLEKGIKVYK